MFTVKATFGNETRKFSFPDAVLFPTYNELQNQLLLRFPISHSYYLSRLIFSPDASRPGRILVGKEVHSAQDYDSYMAPLRRQWPNPLLRFTIFDEVALQNVPDVTTERLSLYSAPTIPLSCQSCVLPLNSQLFVPPSSPPSPQSSATCILPPPPPPPPPPFRVSPPLPSPPIVFSSTPDVPRSKECSTMGTAPCCPIAKGKADIEVLLFSFKEELERILSRTFGSEYAEQQANAILPQTDIPVSSTGVNASKWCFVCRTTFAGIWYGCIKCPWHAVCPGCFSNSHGAHTLSFGPTHVVQQRSTDCSTKVSAQVLGETKSCDGPLPLPDPAASTPVVGPPCPVHRDIICDKCGETPIVGVRHKCLDCPDYDLCTACMESGATEQHNPFHEFLDIETPGRVHVHSVLARENQQVSSGDQIHATQQGTATPVDPPVRHSATCNLCDSVIVGGRYKCVVCPDFDTCPSCFRITAEQHPSHGFVKVSKPEDLMMRDSIRLHQVPHLALCDSCRRTIHGTRYKCMHPSCPDFDLCGDCEALPIPVHPLNHPMLKLKTSDTVIPTVYRVGQTQMVNEPSGQKPVSICDETISRSQTRCSLATSMKSPELIPAVVPGYVSGVVVEDQAGFAEEFLSPLGSPVVPGEAPASFTIAPSHLIDVAEPLEPSQPSLEIHHQLWPRVNQEMMHLNAVSVLEDPAVNPIKNTTTDEEAPLQTAPAPSVSRVDESQRIGPISPVSGARSVIDDYRTPSPVSSNVQESICIANDQQGSTIDLNARRQSHLDSNRVGDVNVPDGQIFPPGAEFVKGWHVMNNGELPWPTTTEVQFVAGEMFAPVCSVALSAKVGLVHPGEDLDIWTGDLKAPDVPGRYVGYWRLNDGQGNFFGSNVWIDLTVVDYHSSQASECSLASSSMVMPSANPTNRSVEFQDAPHPSVPSTETVGSDVSDVSLVSVPTSDDEDAEWQDTRTHSEPLEYVVLYDSNSEE